MAALFEMDDAMVNVAISDVADDINTTKATLSLTDISNQSAFFVRLNLVDDLGDDTLPVFWTDKHTTREQVDLRLEWYELSSDYAIEIPAVNVKRQVLSLSDRDGSYWIAKTTSRTFRNI